MVPTTLRLAVARAAVCHGGLFGVDEPVVDAVGGEDPFQCGGEPGEDGGGGGKGHQHRQQVISLTNRATWGLHGRTVAYQEPSAVVDGSPGEAVGRPTRSRNLLVHAS
jgi:hypothetical protein